MSQVSIIDIEGNHPQIPTEFIADSGTAIPIANQLEILAETVSPASIPTRTVASGNTVTTQIQISKAIGSTDATQIGLAAFNSAHFNVDENGFVSAIGGGAPIDSFTTDQGGPVEGDGAGNVDITGTNVYSDGSAANTISLNLQGTNHALYVGRGNLTPSTSLSLGSSGQLLQSAGAGSDPAWTTSTYPSTTVQGDIIYASANNTLATLAKDTNATRYLSNTGASNSPAWAQIDMSNGITGVVPVVNGGTGSTGITGIVAGNGTAYNGRTLQQPAAGITISNADGSAADPTFALADDLAAVEGLSGTGLATRTASNTWTTRSIDVTASTGISVSNGDGVAGNPTLAGIDATSSVKGVATFDENDFLVTSGDVAIASRVRLQPGFYSNLGISYSAGTFTVRGASASLSSTNKAWICMPSKTAGNNVLVEITANQDFIDDAGASEIIGNLFGLTTGVAVTVDIPFYLYAILNDSENAVAFACARIPNLNFSPAAVKLGKPGSAVADSQGSMFIFDDVTVADYESNPVICLGSFRMRMSASDDWTVQSLVVSQDGIGLYQESINFVFPNGQFGSASSSFFRPNGGTAPTSANTPVYNIKRNGQFQSALLGIISGAGVGAVHLQYVIPFIPLLGGSYSGNGVWIRASDAKIFSLNMQTQSLNYTTLIRYVTDVGTGLVLNSSISISDAFLLNISSTIEVGI